MPKAKADLRTALADIGASTRNPATPKLDMQGAERSQQPSRAGTYAITAHFPKEVRDQLKILAIKQDMTLQDLTAEAFNDLFAKYGQPEIAPILRK